MLTAYVVNSLADVVATDYVITLREALEAANTNSAVCDAPAGSSSVRDEITFASGLFAGGAQTITLGAAGQLEILDDVDIQGPGAGLLSINANNQSRVFYVSAYGQSKISDLKITGGYVQDIDPNTTSDQEGAGIYIYYGDLAITDATIANNESEGRGGGIFVYAYGDLTIDGSTIENNVGGQEGGGILNRSDGVLTITDSVFSGNTTDKSGAGIFSWGEVDISGSTISENTAVASGGGIDVMTAPITIDNCEFSNNSVTGSSSFAGALFIYESAIITNTTFIHNSAELYGGAISNMSDSELDISGSTFTDNSAEYGGGICNFGTLTADNITVNENEAEHGGGIHNSSYGSMTLTGCEVTDNYASSTSLSYGGGGGICNCGDANIIDSTISDNICEGYGGGIFNDTLYSSDSLTITGSTISGNSADTGGGIENYESELTISDSVISDNQGGLAGGVHNYEYNNDAVLTVNDSTFFNNSTNSYGGGIYNYYGELYVNHSQFLGNFAGYDGGGIECWYGTTTTVANSAFVGNTSLYYGGGIDSYGTLTITNSTLAENVSYYGGGVYCDGTLTLANTIVALNTAPSSPNLYGTIVAGGNNIVGSNPGFVRNPDDGGDGWGDDPATPLIDESANDDYGDIHLEAGSPAINAGSNAWAINAQGNPLTVDLDGNPRIVDGTVDIGAYEFSGPNIAAVNDDYDDLAADESHVLDVLANDIYPPGATVSVAIVGLPQWGIATVNPDGTVAYTPYYAFQRDDSFTYSLLIDDVPVDTAEVSLSLVGSGPIPVSTATDEADGDYTPGDLSLREALLLAYELPGTNTITFDTSLNGQSIILEQGQLVIDSNVDIQGPGTELLTVDADHQSRIFYLGDSKTASIYGLRITGGWAEGDGSNYRDDRGGGIFTEYYSSLTISNCVLEGNTAPRVGTSAAYGSGGAVACSGSLTILNSTLKNNDASGSGGAVDTRGSSGTVLIRDTTISSNSAPFGGAIYNTQTMTIESSTLCGNTAAGMGNGGAINNNSSGVLTLINSTISGNTALFGAGILNYATLETTSCTVASNTATYSGGGIETTSATATLTNTIVANNTDSGDGPDVHGTVTSQGYNLIGNTTGSSGFGTTGDLLNIDPQLGPLSDNGGPTWTHALLQGSPAINTADTTAAPTTDQRGILRPQGGAADIGAYEFRLMADANCDGVVNDVDAAILSANWLKPPSAPGDANLDGHVNETDAAIMSANWMTTSGATWADGDFNRDRRVDAFDSAMMATNWQMDCSHLLLSWSDGDFNGDGYVDDIDAVILATNMGQTLTLAAASAAASTESDTETQPADSSMASDDTNDAETNLKTVRYDLDNSGRVDLGDLAVFASVYCEQPGVTTENPYAYAADYDGSGTVDLGDLALFAAHYRSGEANSSLVLEAEAAEASSASAQTASVAPNSKVLVETPFEQTATLQNKQINSLPIEQSIASTEQLGASVQSATIETPDYELSAKTLMPSSGNANRVRQADDEDAVAFMLNWRKSSATKHAGVVFSGDDCIDDRDATILAQHLMMTTEDMDDDDLTHNKVFAQIGAMENMTFLD